MDMHLHDNRDTFRFVLRGELTEAGAQQLRWAWEAAKSILNGKALSVDISAVTKAEPAGIDLLSRMRKSGARITAVGPPESEELLRLFDIRAAGTPADGGPLRRALRMVRATKRLLS